MEGRKQESMSPYLLREPCDGHPLLVHQPLQRRLLLLHSPNHVTQMVHLLFERQDSSVLPAAFLFFFHQNIRELLPVRASGKVCAFVLQLLDLEKEVKMLFIAVAAAAAGGDGGKGGGVLAVLLHIMTNELLAFEKERGGDRRAGRRTVVRGEQGCRIGRPGRLGF